MPSYRFRRCRSVLPVIEQRAKRIVGLLAPRPATIPVPLYERTVDSRRACDEPVSTWYPAFVLRVIWKCVRDALLFGPETAIPKFPQPWFVVSIRSILSAPPLLRTRRPALLMFRI